MEWREVVCFPYLQISGVSKLRLKQIQLRVEVVSFTEIKHRSCVSEARNYYNSARHWCTVSSKSQPH